jgi:carboxyl-terminal processing protease
MKKFAAASAALIFTSFSAIAQMASAPQSLELSCQHLYPIQQKYLEKHINYAKETPNLESRTIDQFIKRLDGSKLYLLQSDEKDIKKVMGGIFDKIKKNDCSGIEKANNIFVKRVKERVEYSKKYLGKNFKFNPKASINRDPEERKRPANMAAANKAHENYMQYQVASYIITDMKEDEARQQIIRNYERALKRVEEYKKEEHYSNYLDSFARALDPHSSYLAADQLEDFEIQMRLSLEGIGATLSSQDGFTVIEQLIPGGSADRSGKLKAKDKIIAVAQGKDGEFTNVIEMDLRDVVRLIRGPKGSEVRLKILRKNAKENPRFEIVLNRDKIKLEDEAASITYHDKDVAGEKKKIALLNLPSFYSDNRKNGRSAATDMKKLLKEAKENKADGIVLDLSNDGGGSLRDAVDIAGLFFSTGNVVKQSQRGTTLSDQSFEELPDTDATVDWPGALVVLTSRVSASASEIVAGALKDYNRAVIVGGDHTFGKGTVQSVEYLPTGLGAIKTTVGMFFTPGGKSTQHIGVTSDIGMPSTLSIDEIGEKTLDYSLPPKTIPAFLSKTAYVTSGPSSWVQVNKSLIKKLYDKAEARVAASKDFKKIQDDIKKNAKRGKVLVAGDLLKDKETKDKSKDGKKNALGKDGEVHVAADDADADDEGANLTREERKKKYLERADVQEALQIGADLAVELSKPGIKIGAKGDAAASKDETSEN